MLWLLGCKEPREERMRDACSQERRVSDSQSKYYLDIKEVATRVEAHAGPRMVTTRVLKVGVSLPVRNCRWLRGWG